MSTAPAEPVYVTSGLLRLTRPQLIGTMLGLLLAASLAAIDQTIVGTAEPRIIASLQGFDRYPWVATIYLLASTVSVPIFASLSDRSGRKPYFMLGALLFVVASALCGAAGQMTFLPLDGMGQLIVFRGLQGVGGGMVTGILFTIVGDIFSPIERGKYQGLFAAIWGIASIFGPTLGGWLTDSWSWRACFYVNLPVGIIALAAIYFEFPNMRPRREARQLDWAGFATLIGCVVPLLLALTWATRYGWTSPRVTSLFVTSAVMLVALIFAERHAKEPIIPLVLFQHPIMAVCSVASFVLGVGMFGTIIYLPLFMQGVLGVSATQSGNLLTPLLMGVVIAAAFGGQTISRTGEYKTIGIAGSILIAIGMIMFARMDLTTARFYVATAMVIAGLGMGLLQPVYTLAVQNVAPAERMGAATSSTIFFRSIGSTVGVAAFGSMMLTRYHHEFTDGLATTLPAAAKPAIPYFENPLLLMQVRPQLEQAFSRAPGGTLLLQRLMLGVKTSLLHGLQEIFFWSAIIMSAAVLLHVVLKREPLRARAPIGESPTVAAAH
ncbi:MAG TPA: MDR family MFS transporter [Vicinamibacterales bacterium]|nr:MDR family MFS transporter [Vicinamibacterales bacterium]